MVILQRNFGVEYYLLGGQARKAAKAETTPQKSDRVPATSSPQGRTQKVGSLVLTHTPLGQEERPSVVLQGGSGMARGLGPELVPSRQRTTCQLSSLALLEDGKPGSINAWRDTTFMQSSLKTEFRVFLDMVRSRAFRNTP